MTLKIPERAAIFRRPKVRRPQELTEVEQFNQDIERMISEGTPPEIETDELPRENSNIPPQYIQFFVNLCLVENLSQYPNIKKFLRLFTNHNKYNENSEGIDFSDIIKKLNQKIREIILRDLIESYEENKDLLKDQEEMRVQLERLKNESLDEFMTGMDDETMHYILLSSEFNSAIQKIMTIDIPDLLANQS